MVLHFSAPFSQIAGSPISGTHFDKTSVRLVSVNRRTAHRTGPLAAQKNSCECLCRARNRCQTVTPQVTGRRASFRQLAQSRAEDD